MKGYQDKEDREKKAADRLFSILPQEQGAHIRQLWEEFDRMDTTDSKYAACLDRIQPFLHNTLTDGHTWHKAMMRPCRAQVEARMRIVKDFMPEVYVWVARNLDNAVEKGWLLP